MARIMKLFLFEFRCTTCKVFTVIQVSVVISAYNREEAVFQSDRLHSINIFFFL